MNAADPLANLRDIHLPPPVGAWPPAPGWWLLAALIAVSVAALIWLGWRTWRRRAYRRAALRELHLLHAQWQRDRDNVALQRHTNRLLKQVALAAFPRTQIAALHGERWLRFLDTTLRRPVFADAALQGFGELDRAAPGTVEPETLLRAARAWIRRHRC